MALFINKVYLVLQLCDGFLIGFMHEFDVKLLQVLTSFIEVMQSEDFLITCV